MFARVTKMTASAEWVEDGIAFIAERAPSTQGQHGFRGAYWLIDRENGQGMAITFWDTEEAMRASEPMGEESRAQTAQSVSGRVLSVERYEVIAQA
jgi:heme-degrading monooxygenase HmoA